jgi:hypothetical protein
MTRSLPGSEEVEGREFLYVESSGNPDLSRLVDDVFAACATPPLPRSGGMIEELAQVVLPDKTSFLAFSYKGDLQGWKAKIQAYCGVGGRKWGIVRRGTFVTSDGNEINLADCDIQFLN